jgi:hypothetical protein
MIGIFPGKASGIFLDGDDGQIGLMNFKKEAAPCGGWYSKAGLVEESSPSLEPLIGSSAV